MVYVAVIFWCCIQREPRWWTLLPFVLPLGYWLGMALVQRLSHPRWYWPVRVTLLLLLVALAVGLMQLQNVLLVSPQRVRLFYFLQEAVMLWLMVAVFARSLLPGKTPLCSAVAVLSHPVMTPAVWRYTRGVTLAWALWIAGLLLVALAVGLMQLQNVLLVSPQRVRLFYFLQEAVMLWLMVAVFARSLLPGKTPLCSAVAVLSHPVMTPAVWRYTRGVTLAWALWIAGLWLVSALLFVAASAQTWAFFSLGVAPVLMAVFFLAEVLLGRRLFLPKSDRSSLWATLATVRKVNWTAFFMQLFQEQDVPAQQQRHETVSSAGLK